MAGSLSYEVRCQLRIKLYDVVKLRRRQDLGSIATFINYKDAVAFKRVKEAQSQAASERNRRANRTKRLLDAGYSPVAASIL